MLKPLDLFIGLKILTVKPDWSQMGLAKLLDVSSYSVNTALKDLQQSKLLTLCHGQLFPIIPNWEEYLICGVKYSFAVEAVQMTAGVPTAYAAKPMSDEIIAGDDPLPVWPYSKGGVRGIAVKPLHPSAPEVIMNDEKTDFYQLLILVDAIRLVNSRAREKNLAEKYLREKLIMIKKNFESYI
jgi:hypothetical protein